MPEITKKDMLAWLDMQRAAAVDRFHKLEDGEESHIEHSPEAEEINVIVAIREQLQEMTAVEYLEVLNEECSKHEGVCNLGNHPCKKCPFDGTCIYGDEVDPRVSVERVKKWKEEQDGQD